MIRDRSIRCIWGLILCNGILGIFTESSGEVEVQTPYANDLGSGWFYYVAHTSNGSYASDYRQHCIRKLDSQSGEWQAWAGSCQPTSAGFKNAKGNKARFYSPHGICSTARGDVVVADTGNHCVRSISQAGMVSTLAGRCGHPGDVDGTSAEALFSDVLDVQCLNNCSVLVTEPGAGRIRLIRDISNTCPPSEPKGQHTGMHWQWLLHWYVWVGVAAIGLVAAVGWYDAKSAGLQQHIRHLMTQPAESESSNANNAETERQASVQRLTMARIFSMRRSNTMRRTQSDSLAAEHTYRTRSARRAARAAQASSDAAATMGCKREYGTASPHGQYSQESHGQNRHSPHGCDGSSPHGHSSDAAHAAVLQHEHSRLSTPQQSVDPNTDVFQLFDAGMLTPQGVDHRSRGSRAVTDAQVGNDV